MTIILVIMGLYCWVYGLMLIYTKDIAWRYTEWSNRLRGAVSDRTDQWDGYATWRGVALLVLGTIFFCSIASLAPSTPASPQIEHFSSFTIDGRPATPVEQQEFDREINTPKASSQKTNISGH